MGKIAILECVPNLDSFRLFNDGFDTTDEALKYLRFNGKDGVTYLTAQLGRKVKCKKVTTMQLEEIEKRGEKDG